MSSQRNPMMGKRIVFLNGEYVDIENAKVSVMDRGLNYGDGLFETMRAYYGKVFRLDLHLERLFQSAANIFLEIPYSREELSLIIDDTIKRNNFQETIIRLTVTRGRSEPGLGICESSSPTLLVYARPVKPLPKEYLENGVKIITVSSSAVRISGLREQIKSCNYLSHIMLKKLADDQGAFEAIMQKDDGTICEGTTSNIFIVTKGIVFTPPISEYVLDGVTRKLVLEIADNLGISHREENFSRHEVIKADEVFLTNTGIEILPVCQVDNCHVGNGKPGVLAESLRANLLNLIEGECN